MQAVGVSETVMSARLHDVTTQNNVIVFKLDWIQRPAVEAVGKKAVVLSWMLEYGQKKKKSKAIPVTGRRGL
jgi:hypothetical protein